MEVCVAPIGARTREGEIVEFKNQQTLVLLQHLLTRIQQHAISADQLGLLATWLDTSPEVPVAQWFKRFPGMTVCGEGEWVKTLLPTAQVPVGDEVR